MFFQARHNFGIVEIDGMLYVLGGEDGEKELISMECYDIYSKTWTKQPDLTMVRKVRATSWWDSHTGFERYCVFIPTVPFDTIDSVKALTVRKSAFAGSFLPSPLPGTCQAGELCREFTGALGSGQRSCACGPHLLRDGTNLGRNQISQTCFLNRHTHLGGSINPLIQR